MIFWNGGGGVPKPVFEPGFETIFSLLKPFFHPENNTIDVLEKIALRKKPESPDSDVSDAENSVSGENLGDTGEQLKLDFKGLRTTSTNKTNASLMNSDFNTQDVKISAMQSKINELETQLTSIRNSANPVSNPLSNPLSAYQIPSNQFSSKPPLPNYQIPDTNSKFLPMDLSNSPYLRVEQQMNEKKAIYNNYRVVLQKCHGNGPKRLKMARNG